MKSIIAITGASGFVGQSLCAELLHRGYYVKALVRWRGSLRQGADDCLETISIGEIGATTDWLSALKGVDYAIHCAARVHVMHESEADALAAYRTVNVEGTKRFAEHAAAVGVRRLVYLSSIKVNGEQTEPGVPFIASDKPGPQDAYGLTKWEAEQALQEVAACTKMEVVVVRAPMVYGPGVKGNLARLLLLVSRGLPLPLGAVDNRRSLLGIDNLADLLLHCIDCPNATGQTFLVSDGEDLSTPELLRRIADAMGRSMYLFPIPISLLRLVGSVTGRPSEVDRLVNNLQIDINKTINTLGWTPKVSVDEGIRKMVSNADYPNT